VCEGLSVFKKSLALFHEYTPASLPHREEQLKRLERYFEPVLREGVSAKVHVHGPIGSGKTVLCKRFGKNLEEKASEQGVNLRFIRINLAYTPTQYYIMSRILEKLSFIYGPRTGIGAEEMFTNVAQVLREKDYTLVLALDEVDTYIKEGGKSRILYMLCRIHELYSDPTPRISLIYISRDLNWLNKLDPATLDTIGRVSGVQLDEYTPEQVRDIIHCRAEEASIPGTVSETVVSFIADLSTHYGAVRYALELLREAGNQAAADGSRRISPEHVRQAHVGILKGSNGAYYPGELSLHKQLYLKACLRALQNTWEPYVSSDDVYAEYLAVCDEYGRKSKDMGVSEPYLQDLQMEGYIILRESGSRVGVDSPVELLGEMLAGALERTLKESLGS